MLARSQGGASGRNGGFALRGGAMPYTTARRTLGRERAAEYRRFSELALERQVLVTEALPERVFRCPPYGRHGFDYWQQPPNRRLVLGGRRDVGRDAEWTAEEELTDEVQRDLERLLVDLLGHAPEITHRWAGIWGTTADELPLVGRLPGEDRVWVACGYSGHGNVLGFACGDLVAKAMLGGPDPQLDLFEPARLG
jgi:glycine/D-amino acid oxidase-like deaminating enzyme